MWEYRIISVAVVGIPDVCSSFVQSLPNSVTNIQLYLVPAKIISLTNTLLSLLGTTIQKEMRRCSKNFMK